MRIAARKNPHTPVPRREQLMMEHQRAVALRKLFPEVERLRIELAFSDPSANSPQPSPQLHTLYPAALAFFRFACPCADCDGDFDLTEAVTALIASTPGRKRAASIGGHLFCHGTRFGYHPSLLSSCPMQLTYMLHSEPRVAA
jgi:hypothetical protein